MSLWALADLHLSFSVPEKSMELFGPLWKGYAQKIERNWKAHVQADDLVLIAGDICWAVRFEEALVDLAWIDALPGTKALFWNGIAIGGARLWDSEEYHFDELIHFQENPHARVRTLEEREQKKERDERLFNRELDRLRLSLQQLDRTAKRRIALTHYPPIGNDLKPSLAAGILEEFRIDVCLFGHLHNLKKEMPLFGEARGVRYALTSCDYLDFTPLKIKI